MLSEVTESPVTEYSWRGNCNVIQIIIISGDVEASGWRVTMASLQSNEEFANRWNEEVWDEGDVDAIEDLVAEEFVMHDPGLPWPVRGTDGVRRVVGKILTAFPDPHVELEAVVAEGEMIAVRNRFTATHEGTYLDVEPTGREIDVPVTAFQRIEDGKLVEEWQLVDRLGMLQQLGVVEPPAQGTD